LVINNRIANLLLGISYFIETELIFLYKPNNIIRTKLKNSNYKYIVIVTITSNSIYINSKKSEN
jgi:hypothetical protein